jgi:Arc/MetJ-type ribon-helix-helix transcriptional regulator
MKHTMTLRLTEWQAKAIEEASRRLGRSASAIVRDAIDAALAERTLAERAGRYKGVLKVPRRDADEWRKQLHERNWRS